MDTALAREALTDQLRRIEADTATETRDRESGDADETANQDFGDAGSEAAAEMDRDLTLRTLRRRRDDTRAALRRLDQGSFGTCAVCGAQIDDERLGIRPETPFCRDHAEEDL